MKTFMVFVLIAIFGISTSNIAYSADIAAGKVMAVEDCDDCHSAEEAALEPLVPNIIGQSKEYLVKSTKDYRDGRREDEDMDMFVEDLSDADIENLSAYYASLK